MSSLIEGYNYDIFISYRQKDNKHDGWVTEFVNNLKGELDSTFKEEISVYFDINPHDGLLETHDVDESLREKLKCIILIPIISRTYCDPKSFAWEHEFKAFVEMTSQDQYGLKVKLPGGNVASRILPIQIHDLDPEDRKCIEKELSGHIRGIEFIYKEPGLDRPLKPNDKQEQNLSKTQYNNQITKVARAIREIISGLKSKAEIPEQTINITEHSHKNKKSRTLYIASSIILVFLLFGSVFFSRKNRSISLEKSVVVLPFINDSPNDSNKYFINGVREEILNNLQKVKDLIVLSTTDQYQEKVQPTIPEIARKLNVNYIVAGSGQKYGNRFIIRVQLLEALKEKHMWSNSYERQIRETSDIIDIQSEIAKAIAAELQVNLTPEENEQIDKTQTKNLTALEFYQRGKAEEINFNTEEPDHPSLKRAQLMYRKALAYDSSFAAAYAGLATVNFYEHYIQDYYTQNFLDSFLILINKSLSVDPKLAEAFYLKGIYHILIGEFESTLKDLDNCLKYNPNYWQAYRLKAYWIYGVNSKNGDYIQSIANLEKAIKLNHGKERSGLIRSLGDIISASGFPELAIKYYKDALSIDNDSIGYYSSLTGLFTFTEYGKAERYNIEWLSLDPENFNAIENLGDLRVFQGDFKTALKYHNKCAEWIRNTNQLGEYYMHRIGYTYWLNGNKEEAYFWFRRQKKFNLTTIEQNRYSAAIAPTSYYDLACVYAFEGKKDSAYLYLRKLDEMKVFPAWWISCIKNDPLLGSLRKDKEFQILVNRLQSKYQAEHERVKKWLEENKML